MNRAKRNEVKTRKKEMENVPALPTVTWITMAPQVSTRATLKNVSEYLSEVPLEEMSVPKRRLCLSPETIIAIENAEKLIESTEKQMSQMNFNALVNDDLEADTLSNRRNDDDSIYIRNVVASVLKNGFYDPGPEIHLNKWKCRSTFTLSSPLTESSSEMAPSPKDDCLACKFKDHEIIEKKNVQDGGNVQHTNPEELVENIMMEGKAEKLSLQKGPSISIKADCFAVQSCKAIDIEPNETIRQLTNQLDNIASYEFHHESFRKEKPDVQTTVKSDYAESKVLAAVYAKSTSNPKWETCATQPSISKSTCDGNSIVSYSPNVKRQTVRIEHLSDSVYEETFDLEEIGLCEPRLLTEIDSFLDYQRKIIRRVHNASAKFDLFLAKTASNELSSSIQKNNHDLYSSTDSSVPNNLSTFRPLNDSELENTELRGSKHSFAIISQNEEYSESFDNAGYFNISELAKLKHSVQHVNSCRRLTFSISPKSSIAKESSAVGSEDLKIKNSPIFKNNNVDRNLAFTSDLRKLNESTCEKDGVDSNSNESARSECKIMKVPIDQQSAKLFENSLGEDDAEVEKWEKSEDAASSANKNIQKDANANTFKLSEYDKINLEAADRLFETIPDVSLSDLHEDTKELENNIVSSNKSCSARKDTDSILTNSENNSALEEPKSDDSTESKIASKLHETRGNLNNLIKMVDENVTNIQPIDASLTNRVNKKTMSNSTEMDLDKSLNEDISKVQNKEYVTSVPVKTSSSRSIVDGKSPRSVEIRDTLDQEKKKKDNVDYATLNNSLHDVQRNDLSNDRFLGIREEESTSKTIHGYFSQDKLNILRNLEACSVLGRRQQDSRVFTSTIIEDIDTCYRFSRFKSSSQSESSLMDEASSPHSEGEIYLNSSASHSLGEIKQIINSSNSSNSPQSVVSATRSKYLIG